MKYWQEFLFIFSWVGMIFFCFYLPFHDQYIPLIFTPFMGYGLGVWFRKSNLFGDSY